MSEQVNPPYVARATPPESNDPETTSQEPSATGSGPTLTHPKGPFDTARAVWRSAPGESHGSRVEVAFIDDLIGLRNGADPQSPVLVFTQDEWDAFVAGAKDGEFDVD